MGTHAIGATDVLAAAERIASDVARAHSEHSRTLSLLTGAELVIKFENLQFTGSFKDRGAANRLRTLDPGSAAAGVLAISAGNHAQGVARMATRLGIAATIVMPTSAPFAKVRDTESLGATVIQAGRTVAESVMAGQALAHEAGLTIVHPYDDPEVIAGQGTVALEMLTDHPELEVLLVPIGGGGLLAGSAVIARQMRPDLEIIGVQSAAYPGMVAALAGTAAPPGGVDTLADGIAVKAPGELTTPIVRDLVDDVLVVRESTIEQAVALYIEIEKTVAEGAGAASLAAVLEHPDRFRGRAVGVVLSGGNIDTRMLASVLMRELVRTERVVTLRITLDDLPGELAPVVALVASEGANLLEIEHRRLFDPISARRANVDLVVETRDAEHGHRLLAALAAAGYDVIRPD